MLFQAAYLVHNAYMVWCLCFYRCYGIRTRENYFTYHQHVVADIQQAKHFFFFGNSSCIFPYCKWSHFVDLMEDRQGENYFPYVHRHIWNCNRSLFLDLRRKLIKKIRKKNVTCEKNDLFVRLHAAEVVCFTLKMVSTLIKNSSPEYRRSIPN